MKNFIYQKGLRVGKPHKSGYLYVKVKDHPFAHNNWILEHRHVMEQHLGRYLETHEEVHHKNEIKNDNRLSNLELCDSVSHKKEHRTKIFKKDIPVIKKLYFNGMSSDQIARRFKVSDKRMNKIIRKYKFKRSPEFTKKYNLGFKWTDELLREIKSFYLKGASMRQTSQKFGVSHITIRNKLIEEGIKIRTSRSGHNRLNVPG